MSVAHWNSDALRGDNGSFCRDYCTAVDLAPDFERFRLAFFFLARDIRNDVVVHLGPCLKRFSRAGYRLICRDENLLDAVLAEGSQCGNVALYGAVRLYGNESALCSETLSLAFDNGKMLGVYLRYYHRHVYRPAVCGVV